MLVSSRATVEDSGARLLREVWALTALGILTVTLRVIAKIKIGKFAFDDILMILALVSQYPSLLNLEGESLTRLHSGMAIS